MKNQSLLRKLEILFEEMKAINKITNIQITSFDINSQESIEKYQTLNNEFFKKMIQLFNYNNFPQIVDDKSYAILNGINFEYLGIKLANRELFRGVKDINYHANILTDKSYHCGFGESFDGLYTTFSYDIALSYTYSEDPSLILKLKIPNCKIIDSISLYADMTNIFCNKKLFNEQHLANLSMLKSFIDAIKDKQNRTLFQTLFLNNISFIAILLGYDAIYDYTYPSFAILNREKICVSQSEYDRIISAANISTKQTEKNF